ncbi:MAG: aminotransferase class IV [Bacteroidota bacterium]|nr:aminotransferase class IV [Bacteroidota bacterium]
MEKVCFNGEFVQVDDIRYEDIKRGFSFGDGAFESIKIINGKPVFLVHHLKRLNSAIKRLKLCSDQPLHLNYIEPIIIDLLRLNEIYEGGVVRISVYRSGKGTYLPKTNDLSYIIETFKLKENLYSTNKKGLKIDVYDDILKPLNMLSPYKLANAQLYVLASVYFKENQLDDALIKNENGNIIETTSSNLFISSNGVLYTPALSEGCVGGIMRMQVINLAITNGMLVYENPIQIQHLLSADEIIITNSIKGIRWVGQYKDKRYYNSLASKLTDLLNREVVNYQTDLMEN